MEEAEIDAQVEQDDDGQIENDAETVGSFQDQAIESMWAEKIVMTAEEKESALGVFPKVWDTI